MATPNTGPISMSQVRTEAGLSGAISFSNIAVKRIAIDTPASGDAYLSRPVKMGNMRGVIYNKGTVTNYVISSNMGASAVRLYKFINPPGAQVGGTYPNWALQAGNFPAGSTVWIVNWGNILGHHGPIGQGGTGGGGVQGGHAVHLNFANQSTVLYNKAGGQIFAGGGGGGKGGYGGQGGQGGTGYYVAVGQEGPYSSGTELGVFRRPDLAISYWKWHAAGFVWQNAFAQTGDQNQVNDGPYRYFRHTAVGTGYDAFGNFFYTIYEIYRQWDYNVYTPGGGGGWGGTGGDGGIGQGYDAAQSGPTNAGRTVGGAGAQGGVNAGWGGQGGTGGVGGWGGGWGAYGFQGATGDTGAGGSGGNAAGGNPGAGGGGGYGGGAPGYWYYGGSSSYGVSNEGSAAGLTG